MFAAVNIFVATNPMVAVYKWIKVMEFVFLGWYVVKTKPRFGAIITPLTIGVFYSSILAIAQFFLQHSVGGPLWWLGERTFDADTPGIARIDWYGRELLRPYATFPHPNVLGGFLAAVLPLVFMSLMSLMGQMKKRMYIVSMAVGVITLLLTFSRSAIVAGGVAIAVAIVNIKYQRSKIKHTNQKLKIITFVVSVIIAIIAIYLLSSIFSLSLFQPGEESIVVRQQLNVAATKLWASSPLFGVGLGNFLVRLPEALPTRTIYFLQPVHNIYLLVLSEVGVVGVMLTLWFTWLLVKSRTSKISKTSQKFFLVFLVPLLTLLLLGLVDHYPLSLQQGQLLLTVLAAMSIARFIK